MSSQRGASCTPGCSSNSANSMKGRARTKTLLAPRAFQALRACKHSNALKLSRWRSIAREFATPALTSTLPTSCKTRFPPRWCLDGRPPPMPTAPSLMRPSTNWSSTPRPRPRAAICVCQRPGKLSLRARLTISGTSFAINPRLRRVDAQAGLHPPALARMRGRLSRLGRPRLRTSQWRRPRRRQAEHRRRELRPQARLWNAGCVSRGQSEAPGQHGRNLCPTRSTSDSTSSTRTPTRPSSSDGSVWACASRAPGMSSTSNDAILIVHSTAGWPRTSNGLTRPIAFGALARRCDGPRPCPSSPNPPHLQGGHGYAQQLACARALDTAGRSRQRGPDPHVREQVMQIRKAILPL